MKISNMTQGKPVITLDSIKSVSKSMIDDKIHRSVGLSSEKGYKSYASRYSLNNTFKDIHPKVKPGSNRTPKLANIQREQ